MNREDKRGIFFGVVGVLTLIVAIIGATLAYFSISAQSATDALTVQAASVQIVYEDGDKLNVSKLIPSSREVAMAAYARWARGEKNGEDNYTMCVDDNNNVVCGVYKYKLTNNGTNPAKITAKVVPSEVTLDENGKPKNPVFTNLSYALYDITEEQKYTKEEQEAGTGVEGQPKTLKTQVGTDGTVPSHTSSVEGETIATSYGEFSLLPEIKTLNGNGSTAEYLLFVWLNEVGDKQNHEQGAVFNGTVYIDVDGSDQITGNITGAE